MDTKATVTKNWISVDGLTLFRNQGVVWLDSEEIELSEMQECLVELLMKDAGKPVRFQAINDALWPEEAGNHGRLMGLVERVREKLGEDEILLVENIGYMLRRGVSVR